MSSAKLRVMRTWPSTSRARQVPHTPDVQENGTSRPAVAAASRMLASSFSKSNSRRMPSRTMVMRARSASPGRASCSTAPPCALPEAPACGATPKRSMWMRSSATPAASSAASASSFIWKGPHTNAWSMPCASTSRPRNSPSLPRSITPLCNGRSVASPENTWCSTRRDMWRFFRSSISSLNIVDLGARLA